MGCKKFFTLKMNCYMWHIAVESSTLPTRRYSLQHFRRLDTPILPLFFVEFWMSLRYYYIDNDVFWLILWIWLIVGTFFWYFDFFFAIAWKCYILIFFAFAWKFAGFCRRPSPGNFSSEHEKNQNINFSRCREIKS